jgi:hypothetical protein
MKKHYFQTLLLPGLLLLSLALSGCARSAHSVDPDLARETLGAVLDTWKKGGSPDGLKAASPAITVRDTDWEKGMALTSYDVLGRGETKGANQYCSVKLVLHDKEGQLEERQVVYVINTSPHRAVIRDLMK